MTVVETITVDSAQQQIKRGIFRDKLGAFVGKSGRTLEKQEALVDAAESEPEKYNKLVADLMENFHEVHGGKTRGSRSASPNETMPP